MLQRPRHEVTACEDECKEVLESQTAKMRAALADEPTAGSTDKHQAYVVKDIKLPGAIVGVCESRGFIERTLKNVVEPLVRQLHPDYRFDGLEIVRYATNCKTQQMKFTIDVRVRMHKIRFRHS